MSKLITLTQGKFAIVDDEDYDWLSRWKWYANSAVNGYVARRAIGSPQKHTFMHRQILKAPLGKMVDHKNHNTLDNRRKNLRLCVNMQNQQNQVVRNTGVSKYKGVSWNKNSHKWQAQIRTAGKVCHIGTFNKEEGAARAYDKRAKELFGEFAHLNFQEK